MVNGSDVLAVPRQDPFQLVVALKFCIHPAASFNIFSYICNYKPSLHIADISQASLEVEARYALIIKKKEASLNSSVLLRLSLAAFPAWVREPEIAMAAVMESEWPPQPLLEFCFGIFAKFQVPAMFLTPSAALTAISALIFYYYHREPTYVDWSSLLWAKLVGAFSFNDFIAFDRVGTNDVL